MSKRYITAREAREILGVSADTISKWIAKGRIRARKISGAGCRAYRFLVLRSSLKDAFKARCNLCGEIFVAKRPGDPAKRKFCSLEHKVEWFGRQKRRYVRRGRPPKDPRARAALRFKKPSRD